MVGCFGLGEGPNKSRFPPDLLVENNPRIDVFALLRCGALVEGVTTEIQIAGRGSLRLIRGVGFLEVNGTKFSIVEDQPEPRICRPWFLCGCGRRCRYLYVRDAIACVKCFSLDNACRHIRRVTPGVGRIERLRKQLGDCELQPFSPLPERKPRRR